MKTTVWFTWVASASALVWAGAAVAQAGIYTCVDAKGRKITSDRPIVECIDREQKELKSDGTVKRTVKPVMTAQEQAAFDEKALQEAEERARQIEEKRKDRALLSRYPDRASHDKERAATMAQIDDVIKAAAKRIGELGVQRKEIDTELEFYKKDPKKAPVALRRQVEDSENSVAVQKRFIGDQEGEKKRANLRFDDELQSLKRLWAVQAGGVGKTAPAKTSASK